MDLERLELCSISLLPLVELKLQLVHVGTTSTRGSNKGQTIEMVIEKQPKFGGLPKLVETTRLSTVEKVDLSFINIDGLDG